MSDNTELGPMKGHEITEAKGLFNHTVYKCVRCEKIAVKRKHFKKGFPCPEAE